MNRLERREANDDYNGEMGHDRAKRDHDEENCDGPGPGGCEFCNQEWDDAINSL